MNISITKSSFTLVSDIKIADIALLQKYNPEALVLCDEEGDQVFAVSYIAPPNDYGCAGPAGIVFDSVTEEGKASVTMVYAQNQEKDVREQLATDAFLALADNLQKITKQITTKVKAIKDLKEKYKDSIKVLE